MALETILENKRAEVSARKAARPLESFSKDVVPSDRSLKAALSKKRTGYILECKKASPSRGLIRPDFDPVQIAGVYTGYADAISVLADEMFFQGSLEYVRAVRDAVTVPVLCKDFTVDPYQVYEARTFGADAVLLMMSVLDDDTYRQCAAACRELSMDPLTEVHDTEELERAVALGAEIIGVNNRNLKTLKTDLETGRRLLPLVPKGTVRVAESGISSHADTVSFRGSCDAFLVGSNLMSAPDLDKACRKIVYGNVKVCGLTSAEGARAAYDAGARYGGLIFTEASPRFVSKKSAQVIRDAAPLEWVGVFVNASEAQVVDTQRMLSLSAVQLHGDETPEYIASLRAALPESCEIWKSVSVGDEPPNLEGTGADKVLVDTASKTARGGTGKRFNWQLLEGADMANVILSGGLSPSSAAEADALGAYALDVNSGVESEPGVKSAEKINQFFSNLRG